MKKGKKKQENEKMIKERKERGGELKRWKGDGRRREGREDK